MTYVEYNNHQPVLIAEILDILLKNKLLTNDDIVIDTTFGRGGYCKKLIENFNGKIIACDRDKEAIAFGKEHFSKRIEFINCCFSELIWYLDKNDTRQRDPHQHNYMHQRDPHQHDQRDPHQHDHMDKHDMSACDKIMDQNGIIDFTQIVKTKWSKKQIRNISANLPQPSSSQLSSPSLPLSQKGKYSAIIADLGVSSPQIDNAKRGFSFKHEGPLDMRMGKLSDHFSKQLTAFDLVNNLEASTLARIFKDFGEEKKAKYLANKICQERQINQFTTTSQLANFIKKNSYYQKIHPATRVFQALRIAVNFELWEIQQLLFHAAYLLKPGGVLIIVAFHSLEDKIVKNFFKCESVKTTKHDPSQLMAQPEVKNDYFWQASNKKVIKPTQSEIEGNLRSRSAKLRFACRNQNFFNDSLKNYYQYQMDSINKNYNWLRNLKLNERNSLLK